MNTITSLGLFITALGVGTILYSYTLDDPRAGCDAKVERIEKAKNLADILYKSGLSAYEFQEVLTKDGLVPVEAQQFRYLQNIALGYHQREVFQRKEFGGK